MPTSIPIMRATTTSADASPCICSRTDASIDALTGAIARPKPRPQAKSTGSLGCSHPGSEGVAKRRRGPACHRQERGRGDRHSGPGDEAVAEALGEPAAGDGSDRHADQEPEEHQGGAELRIRVHGRPGQHRDVEQRRHQRRPHREVGQQRPVGAARPELAGRDERVPRPPLPDHEARRRQRAERQQPERRRERSPRWRGPGRRS